MPVIITNKSYTDNFGNSGLNAYKNNAGDRFNITLDVESNIRVLSGPSAYLNINPIDNQIEWVGGNYLEEGFRTGDSVKITIYDALGASLVSWNATINYVDETIIDLSSLQAAGYDIGAGERLEIIVRLRGRSDLEVFFNHVLNSSSPGSDFSLIDGEGTRILFEDFGSLSIGNFQPGILVGNQSGQFLISAQISRDPNPGNLTRAYRLSIDFVQSGIYNSSWFQSTECLKLYIRMAFSSLLGEADDLYSIIFSEGADTGFFGEPFNSGVNDSTLIQGITGDVSYCSPSTHTIIVDGPTSDVGLGAAYISIDESYYKNRIYRQNQITILLNTFSIGLPFAISQSNEFNASYTITIDNINVAGSQTEITFTFTPNVFFNSFMDDRDLGDRLFYFWVKCGSINHLIFADQLTCELPEGDPLVMINEASFLDHSQNVDTYSGTLDSISFDTEDDAGFFGNFLLEKNKIYDNLSIKIEAFNVITEEDFTLSEFLYNFNGIQISGDGRYLLNESQNIISSLPTNSLKRNSNFKLDPSIDSGNNYGVSLYVPILLRWEYWLQQLNASSDFWPTQNRNWEQYDNFGAWIVRIEIILSDGILSHPYRKKIQINPYDFEDNINSQIEIYRESTGQNVGIVIEGELMRVVATHEILNGQWFGSAWGMITVEPKESAPRYICSSVLPFDNNLSNPLRPLDNMQMVITFLAPNVAKMECIFNPDLLNLSNGIKFTSKIKGCPEDPQLNKTMTDGTIKTTTGGIEKTISN